MSNKRNLKTKKKGSGKKRIKTKHERRIRLKIKNLGKTKKHKRIQYGCKNIIKGGGITFQPLQDAGYKIEDQLNGLSNTIMGENSE